MAVDREWDVAEVADKAEARAEAEWAGPSQEDPVVIACVRPVVIQLPIPRVRHACRSNARNAEPR